MKITDEAVKAFTQYRRSQVAELRPWQPGDDMSGVSVSAEDAKAGSPKSGDMIARNPKNHADQWLVAAAYFADNFEPLAALPHLSQGADKKVFEFGGRVYFYEKRDDRPWGDYWKFVGSEPAPTDTQEGMSEAGEVLGWSWMWGPEGKRNYHAERPNERQFPGKYHDLAPLVRQSALTSAQQEVERLQKEGERQRLSFTMQQEDFRHFMRKADEAEARIAELVKALEPFAEVAFDEHDDLPDNTVVVIKHEKLLDVTFTLGDFRRARVALGGQSNEA